MSLDTRKAVRDLRASGADESLADAIVDLFRQAADLPDVAQLATKDDVALCKADIRADLAEVKSELGADIAGLRSDLGADIAGLRSELGADISKLDVRIATLEAKLTMLMWMIGILGGGALVLQVLTSTLRMLHLG